MVDLMLCPFCGGSAITQHRTLEQTWTVECVDCSAQMPYVGLTKAEAADAWNTRTLPATQADDAGLVEELAGIVLSCPTCEGEGTVCDSPHEDGISVDCPHCLGNGMNIRAILPILHRREQARYFDGLDTGSSQGYDEGRAAERAEVVAWLRDLAGVPAEVLKNYPPNGEVWVLHRSADAIERGQQE